MPRDLPARASLEHLRKQAKDLLREFRERAPVALARFGSLGSTADPARAKLADAQHVIAREHGFISWRKLKAHVERLVEPADAFEALAASIHERDTRRARGVLRRHPELRGRLDEALPGGAFGATPLLTAVGPGNEEMIDLLLDAGADINQRSHWWAGGFGVLDHDDAPVGFLVKRGALVDAYAAARHGMLDRLREIASANPDAVVMRGGDGQTPLHVARSMDVARFLVEHGADVNARDVDHESTAAQYLVRDQQEVVRYLIAQGSETDLLMAAALGDHDLVRRHLDANPGHIHMSVSRRWFPMHDSRAGGHIYIWTLGANKTPYLVAREFGHDVVARLLFDFSPPDVKLAVAAESGDESAVRRILHEHPDIVSSLSEDLRARIAAAAESNDTRAVRLMLGAGWPVDARGSNGATPLHFAAWYGNPEMAREILKYNPPVDARDEAFSGTPLGWAMYGSTRTERIATGDYAGVVEVLLRAGAQPPPAQEDRQVSAEVREILRKWWRQHEV